MRTKTTRRALVTLVAAMAMVFATVGSAFAQYPPDAFIECTEMTPGETATCLIGDLEANTTYHITATLVRIVSGGQAGASFTLASTTVLAQEAPTEVLLEGDFTSDGDGEIVISFGIPADAEEGDEVVIEVEGVGFAVFQVTDDDEAVVAPVTPRPAVTQLPRTGLEVSVLIAIALAALVVGGGALVTARRRGNAAA